MVISITQSSRGIPSSPLLGSVKISTEYLAQIETAISIIYDKYVYTYG